MSCTNGCSCGCCEGLRAVTPAPISNRPGQDALSYRAGEHGSFLETMKARLSSSEFPALAGLGARTPDDPSIALLDGWATVADVLTFYQERLASEGYLRTATERRSVLELARLIGYVPRPGVAAGVSLAYEIDPNAEKPVEIPAGSKSQSLPGPGELPQTFETSERFVARREWNAIKPRLQRPQSIFRVLWGTDASPGARVYLDGTSTGLKPNDALLLQLQVLGRNIPMIARVTEVSPDSAAGRTLVRFSQWGGDEFPTPPELAIRRALLAFSQTPAGQYPTASLPWSILTLVGQFLLWLSAQAAAEPLDPDVKQVLERGYLVQEILSPMELLRQVATNSVSDELLKLGLQQGATRVAELSSDIDESTGQDHGGPIGEKTDELAGALDDLLQHPPAGDTAEARTSALMQRIIAGLAAPRSVPPRSSQDLERDAAALFAASSEVGTQAVAAMAPEIAGELPAAIANARVSPDPLLNVFALRQRSLLFGNAAPLKVTSVDAHSGVAVTAEWTDVDVKDAENPFTVDLELPQASVQPGQWMMLDYSGVGSSSLGAISIPVHLQQGALIARAGQVAAKRARASYGVAGQTSRIGLLDDQGNALRWFTYENPGNQPPAAAFQLIRGVAVYTGAEELPLALEPMEEPICGGDQWIETDGLYLGLESGRWVAISGERSDVPQTSGIRASELVMLDAVQQRVAAPEAPPREPFQPLAGGSRGASAQQGPPPLVFTVEPGERQHTFLKLATPLAYCYRRDTVQLNANVVKATHGETRNETLGSGDARTPLQTFTLRQPPLTYVAANEPDGVSSTLRVYVNGVQWSEADALVALGPTGRGFVTRIDDDGATSVVFGDGQHGARLPTGVENVKAIYRSGIGKPGNVKKGQISQLLSRPLGVKGVSNPIEAAGGADRETRDQIRKNAPLAVMALDRLVSTRDYADFSRTFAGIAKASSARLAAGGREVVHVTIAGLDDIPVPVSSDLYANLTAALRTFGDPIVPVEVRARELLMLVISARLAIHDDFLWEDVVDRVRASLLDRYGFERQELGQSVASSEVIAVIQGQRGVRFVDLEALGAVSQLDDRGALRSPQGIATAARKVIDDAAAQGRAAPFVRVNGIRLAPDGAAVLPAQLAYLLPALPETLILNRIGA